MSKGNDKCEKLAKKVFSSKKSLKNDLHQTNGKDGRNIILEYHTGR